MNKASAVSSLIVGHRGLPLEYGDNTKEGILAAAAVCDMVEFDVRRTRDGVAVLAHDGHLGGTAIVDMDWSALAEFDVGGGPGPARLDDVLQAAGDGADRTGTMLAAHRIAQHGWTSAQAYAEMRAFKFHSFWHGHLKRYVFAFPATFSTDAAFASLRPAAAQPSRSTP